MKREERAGALQETGMLAQLATGARAVIIIASFDNDGTLVLGNAPAETLKRIRDLISDLPGDLVIRRGEP